jgi:hypothetical protein
MSLPHNSGKFIIKSSHTNDSNKGNSVALPVTETTFNFQGSKSESCCVSKIWGFHGGDYKEWCILGCYAVWLLVFLRGVRRLLVTANVVPSSLILVTLMKEALSSSETSVLTGRHYSSCCISSQLLCSWRMSSSGMFGRVALVRSDVSDRRSASVMKVTRIGVLGTTLGVTSNRSTLRRNIIVYRLDVRRLGVRVPRVSRVFTSHFVQSGFWTHPAPYKIGTVGFFS